jgi:hypothetical protein
MSDDLFEKIWLLIVCFWSIGFIALMLIKAFVRPAK